MFVCTAGIYQRYKKEKWWNFTGGWSDLGHTVEQAERRLCPWWWNDSKMWAKFKYEINKLEMMAASGGAVASFLPAWCYAWVTHIKREATIVHNSPANWTKVLAQQPSFSYEGAAATLPEKKKGREGCSSLVIDTRSHLLLFKGLWGGSHPLWRPFSHPLRIQETKETEMF